MKNKNYRKVAAGLVGLALGLGGVAATAAPAAAVDCASWVESNKRVGHLACATSGKYRIALTCTHLTVPSQYLIFGPWASNGKESKASCDSQFVISNLQVDWP